jgi:ATP/ADP translocase
MTSRAVDEVGLTTVAFTSPTVEFIALAILFKIALFVSPAEIDTFTSVETPLIINLIVLIPSPVALKISFPLIEKLEESIVSSLQVVGRKSCDLIQWRLTGL